MFKKNQKREKNLSTPATLLSTSTQIYREICGYNCLALLRRPNRSLKRGRTIFSEKSQSSNAHAHFHSHSLLSLPQFHCSPLAKKLRRVKKKQGEEKKGREKKRKKEGSQITIVLRVETLDRAQRGATATVIWPKPPLDTVKEPP